jgi:hypothetical protein
VLHLSSGGRDLTCSYKILHQAVKPAATLKLQHPGSRWRVYSEIRNMPDAKPLTATSQSSNNL